MVINLEIVELVEKNILAQYLPTNSEMRKLGFVSIAILH